MCSDSQLLWYLQGFALTLAVVALIAAGAALAAHKRNRLLIRRMADEINQSIWTQQVKRKD